MIGVLAFTASTTPSDQRPRDGKRAAYKNPSYETLLQTQGGVYMTEHELGISDRKAYATDCLRRSMRLQKIPYFATRLSTKLCV
jgi:hypothetical protein